TKSVSWQHHRRRNHDKTSQLIYCYSKTIVLHLIFTSSLMIY
ncbi:hypothetical protein HMPREF1599_02434, partial [Escherichia coli 907713]